MRSRDCAICAFQRVDILLVAGDLLIRGTTRSPSSYGLLLVLCMRARSQPLVLSPAIPGGLRVAHALHLPLAQLLALIR